MKPLILISAWFGPWPAWFNFYLETCRANEEVDWLIVTDQELPESRPPNVRFLQMTLREMMQKIGAATGLDLSAIDRPYKLCDLKPTYGHTFEDYLDGYHSYGFADIDVFFGRIRHFYTDEVLERHHVISTHTTIVSGHLAVFRNTPRLRRSYRYIRNWRKQAEEPASSLLDENPYRRVFKSSNKVYSALKQLYWRRPLFVERYSTWGNATMAWWDGGTWPETWLWKDGRLTNTQDGESREFLYLHFMRWQSGKYRNDGSPAPWPPLGDNLATLPWQEVAATGFLASPQGLTRPT